MSASDEQTYTMSWPETMRDVSRTFLMVLAVQGFFLFRTEPLAPWWMVAIGLPGLIALDVAFTRHSFRVRVSKAGIRSMSARVMKWEEVDAVIAHQYGGMILQATWCPSLSVMRSIMTNPTFQRHVLGLLSDDHVLAKYLREQGAALPHRG